MQPTEATRPATADQSRRLKDELSESMSFSSQMKKEDEELSVKALSAFKAKEDEIEKKKMEIRERVLAQLGRVEDETKRLALIREELEGFADPMRKEVTLIRKKIDSLDKEIKPLGNTVQKKEVEYKDALEAFNEKNKEKVELITKLQEHLNLPLPSFRETLQNVDKRHLHRRFVPRLGNDSHCNRGSRNVTGFGI
uniref:Uncharacterized protein n=1 Tax=Brassica campestris TaxID=3711 RepID=A0A3P6D591_BRACM|nr:unnamed protein product [Brassica rapa]